MKGADLSGEAFEQHRNPDGKCSVKIDDSSKSKHKSSNREKSKLFGENNVTGLIIFNRKSV